MSEKTCNSCRYFDWPDYDKQFNEPGTCGRIEHSYQNPDDYRRVAYITGIKAPFNGPSLRCHPNFGCVLWEEMFDHDPRRSKEKP